MDDMANIIDYLEDMTPADRVVELKNFNEKDLEEIAMELHISVHNTPNPDKQTLVYAIAGWFNA